MVCSSIQLSCKLQIKIDQTQFLLVHIEEYNRVSTYNRFSTIFGLFCWKHSEGLHVPLPWTQAERGLQQHLVLVENTGNIHKNFNEFSQKPEDNAMKVLDIKFGSLCRTETANLTAASNHSCWMAFKTISLCLASGCMKDVRFNNYRIPLDTHGKELVSVLSAQSITEGCSSEACRSNPCTQEFICVDLWMTHECR